MEVQTRPRTSATPVSLLACMPRLVAAARERGYALAVHGTMTRDYDLIAVAWTHQAVPAAELVAAILDITGGFILMDLDADPHDFTRRSPEPKPHGRLGWVIHLGNGPFIDLSVIPPEPDSVVRLMDRIDRSVEEFEAQRAARDQNQQQ